MIGGETLGEFQILGFLGSGAMGEVFFARNLHTGVEVAIKRVRRSPGIDGEEKIAAERMGAELERRLSYIDERVTKVFSIQEIGGDLVIEMEYVDGTDLSELLQQSAIQPGQAAVIALELCGLLQNLRTFETELEGRYLSGVIHGDLKPKNIKINKHQQIRVMDFGVAKALSRARDFTASLFGSIAYCSPERLDTGSMDSHSDLWSVGVMLYQMIAGRLPFEGDTPERLERRIRSTQPPDSLPSICPVPLSNIVFKMLSRNLEDRYESAVEVGVDLERFLKGQPVSATVPKRAPSPDATVRTNAPLTDLDGTRRTGVPLRTATRKLPALPQLPLSLRVAGVLALVLLLGVGLFYWLMIRPTVLAWADSRKLKHEIETEHLSAADAWDHYQALLKQKHAGFVMWGLGSPLEDKLMASGDVPIRRFANDDLPKEREWKNAANYFSQALELDSGNKTIKGKLRLCEAHLQRIRATGPTRQTTLNDAVEKFQQAAALMPKSPDPYIGLYRLYVYPLGDYDRAEEALDKAAKLGHTATQRELNTLADSYMARAQQSVRDAEKFSGMAEMGKDYLEHARSDFEHAKELYSRVGSFEHAPDHVIAAMRGMGDVDNRLVEMGLHR